MSRAARPRARSRTGDAELDRAVRELLDDIGPTADRDILLDILVSAVRLAGDGADRLDLKITNSVLKEMRAAFRAFAPYRDFQKVTIFGSARTVPDYPTYVQARELAQALSEHGWMVVTGAGPGIMAAGLEGAGREMSFGVSIRLPFEQGANEFIAGDEKLISMKYFFTRKLMLLKESTGFVSLPGGFGTLDETFELLTLVQTGKASPAPVVLLDEPGGDYWASFDHFVRHAVAPRRLIDPDDLDLYLVTDDAQVAVEELLTFKRNYHSIRWVGQELVVRLLHAPTTDELSRLNAEFADLCLDGAIESRPPLPAEVADNDQLELPRLALRLNTAMPGRFRRLLDALNRLDSLPPAA